MHKAISLHRPPGNAGGVPSERPLASDALTDLPEGTSGSLSIRRFAVNAGDEKAAVLSVRGEVDLATVGRLGEVLAPVLEQGSGPVVLDLCEVSFMDSTGVHLLVDAHERLAPQSRRLAIACREDGQVHRLLALVGLLDLLTVHRSRRSAVTGGDELIRPSPGDRVLRAARDRGLLGRSARAI